MLLLYPLPVSLSPTDPGEGSCRLSSSLHLGPPSYPERQERVRYLFYVLALTQQARLSSSVRKEGQQGLSAVGPHLMDCLKSQTPVAPTARLSCATSPGPNSLCLMKQMAVSSVSTPPGQAMQARHMLKLLLLPWKLD